jgi:hypothetical protein
MLAIIAELIALILVAGVWGSMLFFGAVVAPAVFRSLDPPAAGSFIRQLFPRYYRVLGVACGVASMLLLLALPQQAMALILLALVAGAFLGARHFMLPRINALRDAALAGDPAAERRFQRWHRASVGLNGVQLLIVLYVLARLAG